MCTYSRLNSRLLTFTAFVALLFASAQASSGPTSKLYISYLISFEEGSQISAVQGDAELAYWHAGWGEWAIAVGDTVRTMVYFNTDQYPNGREYLLDGTPTGEVYGQVPAGTNMYDGTTDGVSNYAVDGHTSTVYQFDNTWSNPTPLFVAQQLSAVLSITYDPESGSLWLLESQDAVSGGTEGTVVANYSMDGQFLSSFGTQLSQTAGLALDPQDGTLWLGHSGGNGSLFQFSQDGVLMDEIKRRDESQGGGGGFDPGPQVGIFENAPAGGLIRGLEFSTGPFLRDEEFCLNDIDDDGDGLVDGDDPDCQTPPEPQQSFSTRCLHKPLYPQDGESITIFADTIDQDGNAVDVDAIEVYINNRNQPHTVATGPISSTQVTYTDSGTRLFYGCRSTREDGSVAFTGFRTADIGVPENKDWAAVPVIYHGPVDEKVDLVFFAEEDSYAGNALDPTFQDEMYEMIFDGLLEIPWYVRNFESFNVWLALDTAGVDPKNPNDSSKKCKKDKPGRFKKKYGFADAAGIIHKEACRDNAAFKTFSTGYKGHRLQVVAHEIGHAAFSLADEYEGNTVYFTLPDYPNVLPSLARCTTSALGRNKNADACRPIHGGPAGIWWIFEPVYRKLDDLASETGDLMQQTGFGDSCKTPEGGDELCARYRIGDSEIDRMTWKLDKCSRGKC